MPLVFPWVVMFMNYSKKQRHTVHNEKCFGCYLLLFLQFQLGFQLHTVIMMMYPVVAFLNVFNVYMADMHLLIDTVCGFSGAHP